MAIDTDGGCKALSGASMEALESAINVFLRGTSVAENAVKKLVQAPVIFLSGGTFYAFLFYDTVT